jgi:hypothetical protein
MPCFQCSRCPRSSLVRSNFKFTPASECICVVCWEKVLDDPSAKFAPPRAPVGTWGDPVEAEGPTHATRDPDFN